MPNYICEVCKSDLNNEVSLLGEDTWILHIRSHSKDLYEENVELKKEIKKLEQLIEDYEAGEGI